MAPIDFISRKLWWSALLRPMDAFPPIAESQVRVGPRFTGNGNSLVPKRVNAAFPEVPLEIPDRSALRYTSVVPR